MDSVAQVRRIIVQILLKFFLFRLYSRVEDNLMFEHYNLESSGGVVFDFFCLWPEDKNQDVIKCFKSSN